MPLIPIPIFERDHKKIPLTYVLRGNELDLIPEVAGGKYVTIRLRPDSLDIQATKYVGYIPLNSQYVLHVAPKFSISNLLRLLAESKGDSHTINFFERSYRSLFDPNRTLIDFFALCLNFEFNQLAQKGMWREYIRNNSISTFPAGKISLAPTIIECWSQGNHKLHLERFELSKDTGTNRLIKYAVWLLTSPLTYYSSVEKEVIRNLNYHLHRFNGVKLDHSLNFIRPVERLIQTKSFPQTRPYYTRLCQISLYILKTLGLDILHTGAETTLPSFVVDLEATFEKYLLRTLQRELPKIYDNIQVVDGNTDEGSRALFVNQREYSMTPDIVIFKEDTPLLVIDVKYKTKSETGDRSQVVTYAVGYGTSLSLLIYPASGGQRQGFRPLGVVNNQIQVDEYYFDLAAEDLTTEEQKIVHFVASLLR